MPDLGAYIMENVLKEGKEKAVTNADLQESLHLSRREISATMHQLRQSGHIIVGDNHGYYTPATDEELIAGYNNLWKKAVSNLAVLKPMRAEIVKRGLLPMTAEAMAREARKRKDEPQAENT